MLKKPGALLKQSGRASIFTDFLYMSADYKQIRTLRCSPDLHSFSQ